MLHRLAIIVLFLAPPLAAHAQETPAKRPNILWITCEDMGPHLGCYGDAYATSPNLDALAKKSLRYRRVWSNAPVCAPARTAIMTGMYPTSTGSHHMRSLVSLPRDVTLFSALLRRLGYYCTNNVKEDYNVVKGKEVWDESSAKAHYKNRKPGQPFFAVFNIIVTHESQIRKRPHKLVHDPAKVPLPPYHPDAPEVRHDWTQYYDNIETMDRMVGRLLAELEAAGLADDTIVVFLSDHGSGMPRNKRTPLNCGLHVPLIVHIPDGLRRHAPPDYKAGGVSDRLVSFVDLAPTMLSLAGERPAPFMQGRSFLGQQIAPAPEYLFGFRGRMDERDDVVRSATDGRFVYARNFYPHRIAGQHTAYMFETPTTRVWKSLFDAGKLNEVQSQFWKPRPSEELYDLDSDPHEVRNLAGAPQFADAKRRLANALKKHLADTRDLGFLPEDEMHRRSKDASPLELGRNGEKYPFKRIFEAAWVSTANVAEPIPIDNLKAGLADPEPGVRFWTAVGAHSRGEAFVRAHADILAASLEDSAPSVRIIAAEAFGVHGDAGQVRKAIAVLESLVSLDKNSVYVSLQALAAFDAMGAKAAPAWPTIRDAAKNQAAVEARVRTGPARLIESIQANLPAK